MSKSGASHDNRRLERAVSALACATEALVRATDETQLLEEICRIGVEVVGFRLAWIGYAQHDAERTVVPVAQAGAAQAYLSGLRVSWAERDLGLGPTGLAIRSRRPCVVAEIETDPMFAPWRDMARRHGLRSTIALPIGEGDDTGCIGALMLYSDQPGAFGDQTVALLTGLARNLSHGIAALRMKARHDQAVRDLAESEARYRSLVEMSPDAIIVHRRGLVLFANSASAGIFNAVDAATLVGRPLLDIVHADSHPQAIACIERPPESQSLFEYKLVRFDGHAFDAEVMAATITFHGLPARLLVVRDITERNQVQAQLLQTAKLATLGEIAAGLVHELSQPLNIIRLAAEGAVMLIERGKATPEWQAQQFVLVAEQTERAAEIIDDIRIFSRRETGPVQSFDALAAIRAATDVLAGQLRPDGVDLVIDLPDIATPVRGRRVQLEQVAMNLLTNAHHALREAKSRLPADWCPRIAIAADITGDQLRVTISDNGPGISASVRPRIFEPFFTTKEAGRGTGLGLSVSFSLVAAMGGRLDLVDGAESGACFAIRLPLDRSNAGPCAPAPLPVGPGTGSFGDAHILVVDDEAAAAEALAHYLRALGCRVSLSGTGKQAWELFARDPADVVITDLRMPSGDGEELVAKLRDYDPLQPIIIVTGHLGATERLAANLEDDRCAVLKKPIALGNLGDLVAAFLRPPSD